MRNLPLARPHIHFLLAPAHRSSLIASAERHELTTTVTTFHHTANHESIATVSKVQQMLRLGCRAQKTAVLDPVSKKNTQPTQPLNSTAHLYSLHTATPPPTFFLLALFSLFPPHPSSSLLLPSPISPITLTYLSPCFTFFRNSKRATSQRLFLSLPPLFDFTLALPTTNAFLRNRRLRIRTSYMVQSIPRGLSIRAIAARDLAKRKLFGPQGTCRLRLRLLLPCVRGKNRSRPK